MITFYPGPSKVYEQVPKWVKKAHDAGYLSVNHRSESFQSLYASVENLLKLKLEIPEQYRIVFLSSATESWEVIAQSVVRHSSHHVFSGAFGEKWFKYAHKLNSDVTHKLIDVQHPLRIDQFEVPNHAELIALTHNETSNGSRIPTDVILELRNNYPEKLIACDATSSFGGVRLPMDQADIWFASVQKCLGLPAGLGLMILSPRAVQRANEIGEQYHYNSLNFILANADKHQTHYTPNVLAIYLLHEMLDMVKPIKKTAATLHSRYKRLLKIFKDHPYFSQLIDEESNRSETVLTLTGPPSKIDSVKKKTFKAGIMLGNGYGDLKESTFRIANFPAIRKKEIKHLEEFFTKNPA